MKASKRELCAKWTKIS